MGDERGGRRELFYWEKEEKVSENFSEGRGRPHSKEEKISDPRPPRPLFFFENFRLFFFFLPRRASNTSLFLQRGGGCVSRARVCLFDVIRLLFGHFRDSTE